MQEGDEAWWARKLADNEPTIRRKAIRRLRRWLNLRSSSDKDFTEEDLLKIWKGLFYCVWMSDKPLVQEELVSSISNMIFALDREETRFLFVETFFITMTREWAGIDYLRLDKYLMLVRQMIRVCFELLKIAEWEDSLVKTFLDLMEKYPANAAETDKAIPLSFQCHVADVYVEELVRVGNRNISSSTGNKMLRPYTFLMARASNKVLLERVNRRVFEYAIRVTKDFDDSPTDDEDDEPQRTTSNKKPISYKRMVGGKVKEAMSVPLFSFDYVALANHLFELASKKQVTRSNRGLMYRLIKRLKMLAGGEFPLDRFFPKPGKGLLPKHYRQAAKRLMEADKEVRRDNRERKMAARKRRRKGASRKEKC